ncbi:MAG: RHS repeat-associated core domain-containing protein, partial [Candidatus Diapherotrites archaeon]
PFGEPRVPSNYLQQPMQFSTKPYDENTGLSYYGYRFYVPALGRWLTRDPIGEEGGINLYEFVKNSPVNFIDPKGLKVYPPVCQPEPSCNPYKKCGEWVLYIVCSTAPNDPWSKAVRKCLLDRWNNCQYDNGFWQDHYDCWFKPFNNKL